MPHINLPSEIPGIGSAFAFRPATAKPMRELANILLFEPGPNASLSSRDRELIASYVSSRNSCHFCQASHGAAAANHEGGSKELVESVCGDLESAEISNKLKALLKIAAHIQGDPKTLTPELVEKARQQGATDLDIHDTVLIAAAFCMFNRYVDGLATWQPREDSAYTAMGKRLAENGYVQPAGVGASDAKQRSA
jgi:uncharacterized peroxidase-related enzyme